MAQKELVLCDTNILIELSKNNAEIIRVLKRIGSANIRISAITAGEFLFGALNKVELIKIKRAVESVSIIHPDPVISDLALNLIERYALSHNLDVPDAFIAATAIALDIPLYTLNLKHFKYINGLKLFKQ